MARALLFRITRYPLLPVTSTPRPAPRLAPQLLARYAPSPLRALSSSVSTSSDGPSASRKREEAEDGNVSKEIADYLGMSDDELMEQCEMGTFKASGPGGQHRNKRESAVRLRHRPTGIIAQAVEDRSQHMNRASALARLRTLIALKGKCAVLQGMQALLDLLYAVEGSVSDAAKILGLSTGALSRLILSDDSLRTAANELRASKVTL
ncbi:hypothetical protein PR202_ga08810 [Eleusine coracana subsp. coracana]|uniref:Prokaryotic-type class I peptide chain release factors domain-containing protein n=1 Tax=Eleusine coracana subsp. coracana TaxID=191504 RepID=A0AAV5C2M7_ELECO|nr:hypothetical protein PR202_ga08810 [Eleusine coracana subsp. coracana]